tara:strand:+ start:16013 stop:16891 length:879 start_codon:yes stop_codon:yes gene_type:complete
MFLVKNIINSVTNQDIETALIICDGRQNYAVDLCRVFKKVFFYNRFVEPNLPSNGRIINNVNAGILQPSFDIVVSIGEGKNIDMGHAISKKLHIPFLQVKTVSEFVGISRPFSTPKASHNQYNDSSQVSMYRFVESSSNICIPNIYDDIISNEKDLSYIGIAPVHENFMNMYLGVLSNYPIKLIQTPDPSCGIMIDTWLGNTPLLLECLRAGTTVICPRTPESSKLITEGHNGFLYKDFRELEKLVGYIYSNKDSMVDIGKAGQKLYSEITVDQKTFVHEWKDIIKNIVRRI